MVFVDTKQRLDFYGKHPDSGPNSNFSSLITYIFNPCNMQIRHPLTWSVLAQLLPTHCLGTWVTPSRPASLCNWSVWAEHGQLCYPITSWSLQRLVGRTTQRIGTFHYASRSILKKQLLMITGFRAEVFTHAESHGFGPAYTTLQGRFTVFLPFLPSFLSSCISLSWRISRRYWT